MKTISLTQITVHLLLLSICFCGCSRNPAALDSAADLEEAKDLLNEAISFYKANGEDKTFAEINKPNGRFTRGELYVFAYDSNGAVVAHGNDTSYLGLDITTLQDNEGKFFGKEIMQIGEEGGTVDYIWLNPATGEAQPKTSFIVLVDGFRFGCGVYK